MRYPLTIVVLCSLSACLSPNSDGPALDAATDRGAADLPQDTLSPAGCTPGRVKSCPCVGVALSGAQTCLANGTFGECRCPDVTLDALEFDSSEDVRPDVPREDVVDVPTVDAPADSPTLDVAADVPAADVAADAPDADVAADAFTADAAADTLTADAVADAITTDAAADTLTADAAADAITTDARGADAVGDALTADAATDTSTPDAPTDVPPDASPVCGAGRGDCDGNTTNGCETDLGTSRLHCGRCGAACLSSCIDGACADFRGISAGDRHVCAVRNDGSIWCWGANNAGQLGDGTTMPRSTPVAVVDVAGAFEAAAGAAFTCGRTSSTTFCWGANNNAQLGDGSYTARPLASAVRDLTSPLGLAVGLDHGCALGADRRPWCWGNNAGGALGAASTTTRSSVPLEVASALTYRRITAGYYLTCGLTVTGSAYCWGQNSSGQVGDGTTLDRNIPTAVLTLPDAVDIDAGAYHVCAVLSSGRVACWGHNEAGGLGDGTSGMMRSTWTFVSGLVDAVQISSGAYHTCALRRGGRVLCWGLNDHGQLGDGTTTDRTTPVEVAGGFAAQALSLGGRHSCALALDGRIYCWGQNSDRQLGDGSNTDRAMPVPVRW